MNTDHLMTRDTAENTPNAEDEYECLMSFCNTIEPSKEAEIAER